MVDGYFDPLGYTEPNTALYTLTVFIPPRPASTWLPSVLTRTSYHGPISRSYRIPPDDTNQDLDCFEAKHLSSLPKKCITLKSAYFPAELRCVHIDEGLKREDGRRGCDQGCYFLEKSGKVSRWRCESVGCEGHVYCGQVMGDEGKICFGKKGEKMVCLLRKG